MNKAAPLVSFIILSYNYRHYIGQTIESILAQTVQDFEIVVIDDCSSDGSSEFVRSIGDPRIVVIDNERNLGGSLSFEKAFAASRGQFIANVDSDDWIEPTRTKKQLALFERDPALDIVGTWIRFVDAQGQPHPRRDELEAVANCDWAPNKAESWVVQNRLCRSSTMLRRRVHDEDGLYDPDMTFAPDYELWTRVLRKGRRFALVREPFTIYRQHDKGVTHANAVGSFTEICYLLHRNIIPLAHAVGTTAILTGIMEWVTRAESFALLDAPQRYRLLGLIFAHTPIEHFRDFCTALLGSPDPGLEVSGANLLALNDYSVACSRRTVARGGTLRVRRLRDHWIAHLPALQPLRRAVGRTIRLLRRVVRPAG